MILSAWQKLSRFPFGKALFGFFVWWRVPYTGSLWAKVEKLTAGYAKVTLKERWRLRNHLGSVHAAALMNLGEYASGIAMLSGLPPGIRGIVVQFQITYLKKARGKLTAISECGLTTVEGAMDKKVTAKIFNHGGELVAETVATWRLSPAQAK